MAAFNISTKETSLQRAEREAFDALPRVQQNEKLIAELEREWSILGPMREITFTVQFRDKMGLDALAQAVRDNGFDVAVNALTLKAIRQMEPSAEEFTYWENWFEEKISLLPDFCEEDGCYRPGAEFEGWSYPKKLRPTFMLEADCRLKGFMLSDYLKHKQNRAITSTTDRTRILFGEALCDFEASNSWADREGTERGGEFQIEPSNFIENAERRRPRDPEPTASGFSQWLYSLYSSAFGNDEDITRGTLAEKAIFAERNKAFSAIDHQIMRKHFPGWRLKHNGMNLDENERHPYFKIPELSVRGQALRVLPDLIFENTNTGAHIIVEVKHSYMTIPTNLWPNIWGQLWCYSQMPDIKNSPHVTVVGEVWGDHTYPRGRMREVYLRASVRRDPRKHAFDQFFRRLFDIYRGA